MENKRIKLDLNKLNELSETHVIEVLKPEKLIEYNLPFFLESVSAGFPSPADDYLEDKLDLNDLLVKNPAATFFVRVSGDSMINAGIYSGDILVVDRSVDPKDGNIIIAVLDGELTVKRIGLTSSGVYLYPENEKYKTIKIKEEMNFEVWGVVRTVIHSVFK